MTTACTVSKLVLFRYLTMPHSLPNWTVIFYVAAGRIVLSTQFVAWQKNCYEKAVLLPKILGVYRDLALLYIVSERTSSPLDTNNSKFDFANANRHKSYETATLLRSPHTKKFVHNFLLYDKSTVLQKSVVAQMYFRTETKRTDIK